MTIKIKDECELITPNKLSLDDMADQWVTLVLAHIEAKRNLKKYNNYKFPAELKVYEK